MNKSTIILTAFIIVLTVGHIEWMHLCKEQRAEIARLEDVEIEKIEIGRASCRERV